MGMSFRSIMVSLAVMVCFFALLLHLGATGYKKYSRSAAPVLPKVEKKPVPTSTTNNEDVIRVAKTVKTFQESFIPMPFRTVAGDIETLTTNLFLVEATIPAVRMEGERLENPKAREMHQEFLQFLEQYQETATRLKATYEEWEEASKEKAALQREMIENDDPTRRWDLFTKNVDQLKKLSSVTDYDRLGRDQDKIKALQTTLDHILRKLEKATRPRISM
jgi:hypothetical protein